MVYRANWALGGTHTNSGQLAPATEKEEKRVPGRVLKDVHYLNGKQLMR